MRIDSILLSFSIYLYLPASQSSHTFTDTYTYVHVRLRVRTIHTYTSVLTRSRGRARLRRWRRVTSVPLLSDRTIEKFPRFFMFDHTGGASWSLIGPGRLVIPTREGVDGPCSLSLSLSPFRARSRFVSPLYSIYSRQVFVYATDIDQLSISWTLVDIIFSPPPLPDPVLLPRALPSLPPPNPRTRFIGRCVLANFG